MDVLSVTAVTAEQPRSKPGPIPISRVVTHPIYGPIDKSKIGTSSGNAKSSGYDFVFTINNPTPIELSGTSLWNPKDMQFMVLGFEKAPTTGTPHIQGFVQFKVPPEKRRTVGYVSKNFLPRAWIHVAYADPRVAAEYCEKDKPPELMKHFGSLRTEKLNPSPSAQPPSGGSNQRSNASRNGETSLSVGARLIDRMRNGESFHDLVVADTETAEYFVQHSQGIPNLQKLIDQSKMSFTALFDSNWRYSLPSRGFIGKRSIFMTGPPGIGKTQFALSLFDNPLLVTNPDDLKELRSKHDGLVWDEADFMGDTTSSKGRWPASKIKTLLDQTMSYSVRCRNEDARISAGLPRVFISNDPVENVFPGIDLDVLARSRKAPGMSSQLHIQDGCAILRRLFIIDFAALGFHSERPLFTREGDEDHDADDVEIASSTDTSVHSSPLNLDSSPDDAPLNFGKMEIVEDVEGSPTRLNLVRSSATFVAKPADNKKRKFDEVTPSVTQRIEEIEDSE